MTSLPQTWGNATDDSLLPLDSPRYLRRLAAETRARIGRNGAYILAIEDGARWGEGRATYVGKPILDAKYCRDGRFMVKLASNCEWYPMILSTLAYRLRDGQTGMTIQASRT